MTLMSQLENLEAMISKGRVPGTARTFVNLDKISDSIDRIKSEMPSQIEEAEGIVRQKDAIIKQAEVESRRIRAYADEEATTIRQIAEEQSNTLLNTSQEQAREMVDENEITRAAKENASSIAADAEKHASNLITEAETRVNNILNEAETSAEQRRKGADNYAREVLCTLEDRIADTLGQVRGGIDLLDARPSTNVAD